MSEVKTGREFLSINPDVDAVDGIADSTLAISPVHALHNRLRRGLQQGQGGVAIPGLGKRFPGLGVENTDPDGLPINKRLQIGKRSGRSGLSSQGSFGFASRQRQGRSPSSRQAPEYLLVENQAVSSKLAVFALQRARYKVKAVTSGEQAIEAFESTPTITCILMDIGLDGIDGMETTRRIRTIEAKEKRTPCQIYAFTGNTEVSELHEYIGAGLNGCIAKGELLVPSLKESQKRYKENPDQFVNISSKELDDLAVQLRSPNTIDNDNDNGNDTNDSDHMVEETNNDSNNTTDPKKRRRRKKRRRKKYDCLIVEDVAVSQKVAIRSLTRGGFGPVPASSGEQAIELFKKHNVQIVLMDINLPGMDGIETTDNIRSHEKDQKQSPCLVFGLTGNVSQENMKVYAESKMNGCIAKGTDLGNAVKRAVAMCKAHPGRFVDLTHSASKGTSGSEADNDFDMADGMVV